MHLLIYIYIYICILYFAYEPSKAKERVAAEVYRRTANFKTLLVIETPIGSRNNKVANSVAVSVANTKVRRAKKEVAVPSSKELLTPKLSIKGPKNTPNNKLIKPYMPYIQLATTSLNPKHMLK